MIAWTDHSSTLVLILGAIVLQLSPRSAGPPSPRTHAKAQFAYAVFCLIALVPIDYLRFIRFFSVSYFQAALWILPILPLLLFRCKPRDIGLAFPEKTSTRVGIGVFVTLLLSAFIARKLATPTAQNLFLLGKEFVAILIDPAVPEELFFRGLIQTRFENLLGRVGGLLSATFCFGLLHVSSAMIAYQELDPQHLNKFAVTLICGLVYGFFYQRSRSLVVPAMLHATYNLLAS